MEVHMNNIILIGMPGSGKSSLGVVLAKKIGFGFIDSDLVIQQREGMTLERIIEKHGDAGFIQIENEVNCSISPHHTVIATGGSAVYGKEAMEHLRQIGTVIYLKLDYQTVKRRLGNLKARGVVLEEGQTLHDLYCERIPYYEKYADITVELDKLSIGNSLEKVLENL